jgi:hypothetical protein
MRRCRFFRLAKGHRRIARDNPGPAFRQGNDREAAALLFEAIVIVEVTAEPDGVTVDGENEHASPVGKPEQAKLTAWVNPLEGVTARVIVVDWPELIVAVVGEDDSVNEGWGILMVYAAAATALLA